MYFSRFFVPLHAEMEQTFKEIRDQQTFKEIRDQLARRILVMDGAMGTRIQAFGLPADSIYVGKDVSETKEQGDVVLGQGNITLKANKVIIRNSTKVPLGTKLKIGN